MIELPKKGMLYMLRTAFKTKAVKRSAGMVTAVLLAFSPLFYFNASAEAGETDFLYEKGIRIGVGTGTMSEQFVREELPDAQLFYYGKYEGYKAVEEGRLDAYLYEKKQMEIAIKNGVSGVRVLDSTVGESVSIALGISEYSEIPDLEKKVNGFIAEHKADGLLDDMYERWVMKGDYTMPDIESPSSPKYTLKVGTAGDVEPYSFYSGDTITGYDIELSRRLALYLDANLEIVPYNWDSIVPACQTGKVDIVSSNLNKTPERAEVITFSDDLFTVENGVMVADNGAGETAPVSLRDYNGKNIGVIGGTPTEDAAVKAFPDSKLFYYNNYHDLNAALLTGHIDAYTADEAEIISIHKEQPEIDYIDEYISYDEYSFGFKKDDDRAAALCSEFNDFLARCRSDGTMEELREVWFGEDEARKTVDMSVLTGENGKIKVVTTSADMPYSYIKDGKNVGYDIDLTVRFCKERGYSLEIGDTDFTGRIPAVQSGKYDFSTDMRVTPERMEEILFSDPTDSGGIVLAVKASDLAIASEAVSERSFWVSLKESFEKTFIREDRYKLFVSGIITTVLITVLSIVCGTVLGFVIYMLTRKGNRAANAAAGIFVWLVQGMPMVVLLMILYYIIFAKANISGTAVSVAAFTMVFGSGVYGMLVSGVGAVDKGQTEAAYSLGYGDIHSFFRIILPQAIPHFLPAFNAQVITLIKATAVVGYIAVQDLTKMGDIVRGRTYDAFFPLISMAVIYFVLGGLMTVIIKNIRFLADPKKRSREQILKGVKTDDKDQRS